MSDSPSDDITDLWFEHRAPEMAAAWRSFHDSVYETATLERSVQELIAAASGAVLRCRHCTRSHIEKSQEEGASQEEIAEALMTASLIASGSQLAWMMDDYQNLLG